MDTRVQQKIAELTEQLEKLRSYERLEKELIADGLLDEPFRPKGVEATKPERTHVAHDSGGGKEDEVASVLKKRGCFLTIGGIRDALKNDGLLDERVLALSDADQKRSVSRTVYRMSIKGTILQYPGTKRNGGWGLKEWFLSPDQVLAQYNKGV